MNQPTKARSQLTQMIVLIAIGLVALYAVMHSPRFEQFRTVDVVLLVAAGLCFGVAFSLLLSRSKRGIR